MAEQEPAKSLTPEESAARKRLQIWSKSSAFRGDFYTWISLSRMQKTVSFEVSSVPFAMRELGTIYLRSETGGVAKFWELLEELSKMATEMANQELEEEEEEDDREEGMPQAS